MQTLSTKIEKQIFVFSLFMQKSNFDWNVQWIAEWAVEYKARGGSNDKGFAKPNLFHLKSHWAYRHGK